MLLLSAAGMLVMTTANDLIVVFLALEVAVDPALRAARRSTGAGSRRRRRASSTSCWARSPRRSSSTASRSCTAPPGTASLTGIAQFLVSNTLFEQGTLLAGFALLLVGLGVQGRGGRRSTCGRPTSTRARPRPITAFMSSATKAAGFAALPAHLHWWRSRSTAPTGARSVVGAGRADARRRQRRRRRPDRPQARAGVLVDRQRGLHPHRLRRRPVDDRAAAAAVEAALFYLFAYTFMTIGAFAVVTVVGRRATTTIHSFDQYRGLGSQPPVLGGLLALLPAGAGRGARSPAGSSPSCRCSGPRSTPGEYVAGRWSASLPRSCWPSSTCASHRGHLAGDDEAGEAAPARRRRSAPPRWSCSWPPASWCSLLGILPGTFLHFARDAASLI